MLDVDSKKGIQRRGIIENKSDKDNHTLHHLPVLHLPKVYKSPSSVIKAECPDPHAPPTTLASLLRSVKTVGLYRLVVSPKPSCMSSFLPHANKRLSSLTPE